MDKIILTASGGSFRDYTKSDLENVTVEKALKHPNWEMGAKVTIDSATLMNKGLELIEACHLFDVPEGQVDVVIHPQSIIHSMVRYVDGSVLSQMGMPDMKVPIAYALSYPERMNVNTPPLDFTQLGQMTFRATNDELFPALMIARECQRIGQGATNVMNAANEIAVHAFLNNKIPFLSITDVVLSVLECVDISTIPSDLAGVFVQDENARHMARDIISNM